MRGRGRDEIQSFASDRSNALPDHPSWLRYETVALIFWCTTQFPRLSVWFQRISESATKTNHINWTFHIFVQKWKILSTDCENPAGWRLSDRGTADSRKPKASSKWLLICTFVPRIGFSNGCWVTYPLCLKKILRPCPSATSRYVAKA